MFIFAFVRMKPGFCIQISGGACGLVLTANAVMFLTILGFFLAFDNDDHRYSVWQMLRIHVYRQTRIYSSSSKQIDSNILVYFQQMDSNLLEFFLVCRFEYFRVLSRYQIDLNIFEFFLVDRLRQTSRTFQKVDKNILELFLSRQTRI